MDIVINCLHASLICVTDEWPYALTIATHAGIFAMCTIVAAYSIGRTLPDGGLAAVTVHVVQEDGSSAFPIGSHACGR